MKSTADDGDGLTSVKDELMVVVFLASLAIAPTPLSLFFALLSDIEACVVEVKQEVDSAFVDRTIQKRTSVGVVQRTVAMAKETNENSLSVDRAIESLLFCSRSDNNEEPIEGKYQNEFANFD